MNFLEGLGAGAGQAAGSGLMNLITGWATGGFKGRPQWRDINFMNDVQNRLWPDEIKRQGQFLEGMAPSQANAYNTYQDQTYQQDVSRQTAGIKSMADELGMNYWELTGQGGSAALDPSAGSAGQQQGSSNMGQYLAGIIPLQQTKMQNAAMLQGKAMDNQTQLALEDKRQGGGAKAQSEIALNAAHTTEAIARAGLTGSQEALNKALTTQAGATTAESQARTGLAKQQTTLAHYQSLTEQERANLTSAETKKIAAGMVMDNIRLAMEASPKTFVKTPGGIEVHGYTMSGQFLDLLDKTRGDAWQYLTDDQAELALKTGTIVAKRYAGGGKALTGEIGDLIQGTGDFLKSTTDDLGDLFGNKSWDDPQAYKGLKRIWPGKDAGE